jgi:hypothetical protein
MTWTWYMRPTVIVDWNADAGGTGEDISAYVRSIRGQYGAVETLQSGSCTLVVSNQDGRFSPQNAAGPYYGNLVPGRKVTITLPLEDGVTETPYLFTGYIERIVPESAAAESHDLRATITIGQVLHYYELRRANTTLQADQRTDQLISTLIDTLSWEGLWKWDTSKWDTGIWSGANVDLRDFDEGVTTVVWQQYQDDPVMPALRELVNLEQGYLWVARDGRLHFENRHHRALDTTPAATLTDVHISELDVEVDEDDIANHIEVTAYPRAIGSAATVCWSANAEDSSIRLGPSESRDFNPSWTDPETGERCEVTDIVSPVGGTDYIAKQNSDGTGSTLTGSITVTEVTERERYFLRIENTAAVTVYLTKLQLRATPLVSYDSVTITKTDSTSVFAYMEREKRFQNKLLSDVLEAQALAEFMLFMNKDPVPRLKSLTMSSIVGAEVRLLQKTLEISDRVTVTSEDNFLDGDYFIDRITFEMAGDLEQLTTRYELSAAAPASWIWDTSKYRTDAHLWGY